jgi:hypothetical protein
MAHGPSKDNHKTKPARPFDDCIRTTFSYWNRGDPVQSYKTLGGPLKTSLGWYRHWVRDSTWRPHQPNLHLPCRIFPDGQEAELARRLRNNYLSTRYLFTNVDFRLTAIDTSDQWTLIDGEAEIPTFRQFMG